jgi:hypothetical protein
VSVEPGGVHGWLDAAGLELLLREVLQAILRVCLPGERLHVDCLQAGGRATLSITGDSSNPPLLAPHVLERLNALAGPIGATITTGERTTVSIPFRSGGAVSPGERERVVARDCGGLSDGEARHDVRSARESHHGQAGAD